MKNITFLIIYLFLQINLIANNDIHFTKKEQEWLNKHSSITIGIDTNFAPFEFLDENNEFSGITSDYLKEMEKILNIKFNIITTKNWNEIIDMAKNKSIDVLSCIVKTDQREKYLNFTNTYLSFPMVIVTNKTVGFINGIKNLKGKTVAVIDGYTPQQLLQSNYKNIHLVKTKNLEQSLELVASGKTFAHVGNLSRVTYMLKKEGFQNLSISGIAKYRYNFSMGIRKDDPILRNIIQKSFDAIPKKTKDAIYYKWFPSQYNQAVDYTLVWKIAIISILIITIFSFWMYRLKKEIKRRKLIETRLKKNAKWLNKSLKKANIGAWSWDLRTNIITGNSVYANILGFEDKEIELHAKDFQEDFIHKEDLSLVLKELEDYFTDVVQTCSAQFRIHSKDGTIKKIESNGEIFQYDTYNNPSIMIGFIKEIK